MADGRPVFFDNMSRETPMSASEYPVRRLPSGELDCDQATIGKLVVGYNPDDERFYVAKDVPWGHDDHALYMASFKERRNAIYWAKTHQHLG